FFYYCLYCVRYISFFVTFWLSKLESFIAFLSKSFLEKVTKFNITKESD
ncbi:unnamed protein product, partial [Larinioides sclopetarius]